jgi:ParB family chromosome partitioning protein
MMKQTFGKGIESLIPNKKNKIKQSLPEKKESIFFVDINKVKANPYQPRKDFDQDALESLAESIREHGIIQPMVVSKVQKDVERGSDVEYQLIAGERRLLASKMIGLKEVPIIIRQPSEKEKLEVSIIENVQRKDLNSIEKAEAYKRLEQEFGFGHEQIAKMVGVSRPVVTNTIRLLDLPQEIKKAVSQGKIGMAQARAILMAKEPKEQKELFSKIIKEGLTVEEIEKQVQKLAVWQPKPKTVKFLQEFNELEEQAKKLFGIETLKFGSEKGLVKLTIFFTDKKQAEDLLEKFDPTTTFLKKSGEGLTKIDKKVV